jgi:carbonic anhydrase/acetyltransferase-like protein (isoleucine patch superfamily)
MTTGGHPPPLSAEVNFVPSAERHRHNKEITMTKKFELVAELTKEFFGKKLFRIRALVSFGDVDEGELGGWVEKEECLDQSGDAWVSGNAQVSGDAQVSGNARVYGDAWVSGNAQVSGNARVYGDAWVSGNAQVYGDAWVSGNAQVSGDARVYGDAWVSGNARVYGDAQVSGDAQVYGDAQVSGNAWVSGNARVYGDAQVSGNARVYGDAQVSGDAQVYGDAWVSGNAHWITVGPIGSENGFLTAFRQKDNSIIVRRGCFSGAIDEFERAVTERHGDNDHGNIYLALIPVIKLRLAEVSE